MGRSERLGQAVRNETEALRSVVVHELGHVLHNQVLGGAVGPSGVQHLWVRYRYHNPDAPVNWQDVAGELSEYAGENVAEMTAEAFAAVSIYGGAAPESARRWVQWLADELADQQS